LHDGESGDVIVEEAWHRGDKAACDSVSGVIDDSVFISEFHQGPEFIPDRTILSILDVVRALFPLPPFLEGVGGDADDEGSAGFVQDRIVIISREWLWFQLKEGCR